LRRAPELDLNLCRGLCLRTCGLMVQVIDLFMDDSPNLMLQRDGHSLVCFHRVKGLRFPLTKFFLIRAVLQRQRADAADGCLMVRLDCVGELCVGLKTIPELGDVVFVVQGVGCRHGVLRVAGFVREVVQFAVHDAELPFVAVTLVCAADVGVRQLSLQLRAVLLVVLVSSARLLQIVVDLLQERLRMHLSVH